MISLIYATMISVYFTGLCAIRSDGFKLTEVIQLHLSIFSLSIYYFWMVTLTGDRILSRCKKLKDDSISSLIWNRCVQSNEIEWFSLILKELNSYNLYITGGNMIILKNSSKLDVTVVLITYCFNMWNGLSYLHLLKF